jgi:hypothetical protein
VHGRYLVLGTRCLVIGVGDRCSLGPLGPVSPVSTVSTVGRTQVRRQAADRLRCCATCCRSDGRAVRRFRRTPTTTDHRDLSFSSRDLSLPVIFLFPTPRPPIPAPHGPTTRLTLRPEGCLGSGERRPAGPERPISPGSIFSPRLGIGIGDHRSATVRHRPWSMHRLFGLLVGRMVG